VKLRIISGQYGGRSIDGSGTTKTHPMGERIRGSLFNIINSELKDAHVLDAFAGSGSLGIEALSRGASTAVFVERDKPAIEVITANISLLKIDPAATKIVKSTVSSWVDTYKGEGFDVIFADPPYDDPQLSTAMKLIGLLKPNGLMVLSYPGRGEAPTGAGVVVVDNRSYGTAALVFYRREDI